MLCNGSVRLEVPCGWTSFYALVTTVKFFVRALCTFSVLQELAWT